MSAFIVTVRTPTWCFSYTHIAHHSCDCIDAAIDNFGIAAISAKPVEVIHG